MGSDIFEDISKKISKTAEDVGRKTNEVIERQRLRNQIVTMEREIGLLYESMGKLLWERYEEEEPVEAEFLQPCETIAEKKEMIAKYKADLLAFSGSKACKTCGALLDKEDAFCKKCGTNMEKSKGNEEDKEDGKEKENQEERESQENRDKQEDRVSQEERESQEERDIQD